MPVSITLWDVQHGSAAYVRTPDGKHIVVDLGVGSVGRSTLAWSPLHHLQANYGVQRVDEVIITHPHRDHLEDVGNVDTLRPRVLRRPRHLTEVEIRQGNRARDSTILDKYFELDRRYSEPLGPGENPEDEAHNGGVLIECFEPSQCARTNLNNHSIITFFTHAGTTVCLPGDNEAPSWRELLGGSRFQALLRQTDILVASHHGREAGYCGDLFEYCSPDLVLVSDGPVSETSAVDRYRNHARGWPVWSRSTGERADRWVLTTRSDGVLVVEWGRGDDGNYMAVSID